MYCLCLKRQKGQIQPYSGWTLYEGSSGNMGVELARYGLEKGYDVHIFIENDQSQVKIDRLRKLGARVTLVPRVAPSHPEYYATLAKTHASFDRRQKGYFCNQFHNMASAYGHSKNTGPAIAAAFFKQNPFQTIDAIVVGTGTGGTIAGLSHYFHHTYSMELAKKIVTEDTSSCPVLTSTNLTHSANVHICLADVPGSALANYVKHGVCWDESEAMVIPGIRKTWVDGIGQNRLTDLFLAAEIDSAQQVADQASKDMVLWMKSLEGLQLGPSSAVNLCAVEQLIQSGTLLRPVNDEMGRNPENEQRFNIVTILHDTPHWYPEKS